LHNFSGELGEGYKRLAWKNCAMFFREMAVGYMNLLEKTMQFLGGWPVEHPYVVSKLNRMLGNWVNAHENFVVFRVRNRSADYMTIWKNYTIF